MAVKPRTARLESDLVDAIARSAFGTVAELSRLAAENELSLTQLRVLAILRDRRVRIGALVEHLGLDKSTLTGLVDRAERRGLLRRVRAATDRRSVEVELTAEGRALAGRLTRETASRLRPRLLALSQTDQHQLLALLAKLNDQTTVDGLP